MLNGQNRLCLMLKRILSSTLLFCYLNLFGKCDRFCFMIAFIIACLKSLYSS